ncbi:MAG: DinB family protein [Phycisphaerales bacterium]|nr:DinB family protein [Phycisphaerales bacterium]
MQPTNPAEVLLAHDHWANIKLYASCRSLSEEQFHHPFEMGTGSIHNNLVHNLGAMRGWTDVLNEAERRPRLEEGRHTIPEIEALHGKVAAEFRAAALAKPFDAVLTPSRNGQSYRFTAGGILTHVATHSMHHRAQCLNMLRQLGVVDLPESSVMEWMLAGDTQ